MSRMAGRAQVAEHAEHVVGVQWRQEITIVIYEIRDVPVDKPVSQEPRGTGAGAQGRR